MTTPGGAAQPAINAGYKQGPGPEWLPRDDEPPVPAEFPESAKAGPDVTSPPVDLYPASHTPGAYDEQPAEEANWTFAVDQAHQAMGQMTAPVDPHTAAVSLDGPFTTDTTQPGLQTYGKPGD